jgi:hypothetical protein
MPHNSWSGANSQEDRGVWNAKGGRDQGAWKECSRETLAPEGCDSDRLPDARADALTRSGSAFGRKVIRSCEQQIE